MTKVSLDKRQTKVAVVSAVDMTFKFLLLSQIKAAQRAGFLIHGLCAEGPSFQALRELGLRMSAVTIKRSISPLSDLVALWKMYRYFKREKITIVHTHTPKCSLLGQLAAKLAAVPIIVNTIHGFYFHENMKPISRWFYIAMEWIAARCSTAILSQNPEDIETAVKLGICKRSKIKLLGNGVDLAKFDPDRFEADFKRRKRAQIGIDDDAIIVGIIGRLVKEKGYLELFKAMRNVTTTNQKVRLIIIGSEEPQKPDRISVSTFAEYGLAKKILWLGIREDIPELLACCDIYVLPSWREGFPRSAIEAAAMGLPIVATNIRGCRQVVDNGVTGLLVPLRDSDALALAIEKLVADQEIRKKMGQAGYAKARREFDERKVCRIVLNTYQKLLRKTGGDGCFRDAGAGCRW